MQNFILSIFQYLNNQSNFVGVKAKVTNSPISKAMTKHD